MNEIRGIFDRTKQSTGEEFYSVIDTSDARLDLRWEDGLRCSIPYVHLHDIRYAPRNAEGLEEIMLNAPGFSVVRITGRKLGAIYSALVGQRVSWIRERAQHEEIPADGLSVELIEFTALTDWRVDAEALVERRAALLKD